MGAAVLYKNSITSLTRKIKEGIDDAYTESNKTRLLAHSCKSATKKKLAIDALHATGFVNRNKR